VASTAINYVIIATPKLNQKTAASTGSSCRELALRLNILHEGRLNEVAEVVIEVRRVKISEV
jgi:hypothetical protein